MKLKNIAKASLALGILTTGIITTTAQPVKASETNSRLNIISSGTQELKTYYTGASFDYKNLKGYREGNIATFIFNSQQIDVTLTENEKNRFEDGNGIQNVDLFIVREGTGRQATDYSIGGISKTNRDNYKDYVDRPHIEIKRQYGMFTTVKSDTDFYINKEEISLKELDFKLRKHLIDKHDLYKTEPKDSKIRVTMKDGGFYTFELNKKLQEHRMGDVIDGRNIEKIEVNL